LLLPLAFGLALLVFGLSALLLLLCLSFVVTPLLFGLALLILVAAAAFILGLSRPLFFAFLPLLLSSHSPVITVFRLGVRDAGRD
jgi:hypothetical protein